ncbi:MAG TPA: PEP-CTERM sorting domain-containing protein [Vicinamibacterales bacterium]|nr:PEP-CTERM sorting domain-containing protein [Vicinamibacterales bacterium]
MLLLNRFRIALIRCALGLAALGGVAALFLAYHYLHSSSPSGDAVADVANAAIEEPVAPDAGTGVTGSHTSNPPTGQTDERARQALASLLAAGNQGSDLSAYDGLNLPSEPAEQVDEFLIFGGFEDLVAGCESCGPWATFDVPELQLAGMGFIATPGASGMFGRLPSGRDGGGASGGSGGSGGASGGSGGDGPEMKVTPSPTSTSLPPGGSVGDDQDDEDTDEDPVQTPNNNGPSDEIHQTSNGPSDETPNDGEPGSDPNGDPERPVSVPEPSTLLLAGFGLSGLAATRRWSRRSR